MPLSTETSPTVELELLGPCNYKCWYCFGERTTMAFPEPVLHDLSKLKDLYTSIRVRGPIRTKTWARGTEPGLHPQIKDIATLCTGFGPLIILTNLSVSVTEWLPSPTNCSLWVTIHPQAEEDIEGFFARVAQAQSLGYKLVIGFDITRQAETDYKQRLAAMGLRLNPHNLRQNAPKKSGEQKEAAALRDAGLLCSAGHDRFFIRAETILWRCTKARGPLAEVLPAPAPCKYSANCTLWRVPE